MVIAAINFYCNSCATELSPEVDLAVIASGILVGNSLFHNPKRSDTQNQALDEIYKGLKIGGIGITEMERGSDSVNMRTVGSIDADGSITYNGTKIYTTNGAVADYFIAETGVGGGGGESAGAVSREVFRSERAALSREAAGRAPGSD